MYPRFLTAFAVCALLATALLLPRAARAAPIAYEPFAAYHYDQNLGAASQPAPPASTGILDYTTTNTILTHHARTGSLSYGDLERSGGKLDLNTGGVALNAPLNLSADGPFKDYLQNGVVGKDGTTLYLSLLLQLRGTRTDAQAYLALREGTTERLLIGQAWGSSVFRVGNNLSGRSLNTAVHFVVVRINYVSGNDTVTVWWDPDLALGEGQTATNTHARNTSFNQLLFQGQNNAIFIDEIRFGSSWADVAPRVAASYTLSVSAGANGRVHRAPVQTTYLPGDVVYLEAIPDSGYRFSHWSGDVPSGSANTNPLRLAMNATRSLTAHFTPGIPAFFNFEEPADNYSSAALLDLRSLNEPLAGQSGFVRREGDTLVLGDGTPARFWAATVGAPGGSSLNSMLRFLSKRGVNLVRWHSSLYNNSASSLAAVNDGRIDDAQRIAATARAQGVYTKLSPFFILGLRIRAEWGLDGYTSAWISANDGGSGEPNHANEAPFGLQFFDETFKSAYKNWITQLLTRPNPHHPQQTPLGQDPAVAILELQNEDNLFFWTFNPARYPVEQRRKLFALFHNWLVAKYGSITAARSSWGWTTTLSNNSLYSGDDLANGRATVLSAYYMTRSYAGSAPERARIADQITFLTELQRGWYAEMQAFVRHTLGSPLLTVASNWQTADDPVLLDAEIHTYTAADIIDKHNYISPLINNTAVTNIVSGGDTFHAIPGINNPRALPTVYKHARGHPAIVSESTWVNPHDWKAEAPLLVAAYGALSGLDGFVWFATSNTHWQNGLGRWEIASPALAGTFPAAALLYRRGDVATGPVVVREGRRVSDIAARRAALFYETRGWDPTRNPDGTLITDPSAGGAGSIDTLAALVGRVEIDFTTDADEVSPLLSTHINNSTRTVTSATGELTLHWGQAPGVSPPNPAPPSGLLRIDTARAQAAVGHLGAAGLVSLGQVSIRMRNAFGSVAVVSLDGQPLATSQRVLVQAATRENLRRARTEPVNLTRDGVTYLGKRILEIGELPWQMEGVDADLTLRGTGRIQAIRVLDANGYLRATRPAPALQGDEQTFALSADALYTILELEPPPAPAGYSAWSAFSSAQHADPTISGPAADPDGDGLPNLVEYALGLDPLSPDSGGGSPALALDDATAGGPWLRFTFLRDTRAADVTARVQSSPDLAAWSDVVIDGVNAIQETLETSVGGQPHLQRLLVRIRLPPEAPRRFLRLRVDLP